MIKTSRAIAILAGGKSTRMGQDKSFLLLQDKPIFNYVLAAIQPLKLPTILISNQPEKYAGYNLPIYPDIIPNAGSLGGVYTAIMQSPAQYTLCLACDMPSLSSNLLSYLFSLADDYDVVVPCTSAGIEPLHAIYSKTCLPVICTKIGAGELQISGFYEGLKVRYVNEAEITPIDPNLCSFMNINTPEEWQTFKPDMK